MNKNNNVFDSKQYQLILKKIKDWIHEMKEDEQKQSFELPEEWDEQFRDTIREKLIQKKRKTRKKRIRTWGIAAAVVLVIGIFWNVQNVRGDGWLEIIKSLFVVDGKENMSFGDEEHYVVDVDDSEKIKFNEISMKQIAKKIYEKEKIPIGCLGYIPEGYALGESTYRNTFSIMNIDIKKENSMIFISQRKLDTGETFGKTEHQVIATITNENIGEKISIYEMEQKESYAFYIQIENSIFACNVDDSLEECKKIAENIYLIKGDNNEN